MKKKEKVDRQYIAKRVKHIVVGRYVDEENYSETEYFGNIGLDSLDCIEISIFMEREFMIDIPDDMYRKFSNFKEYIDYIYKLKNK